MNRLAKRPSDRPPERDPLDDPDPLDDLPLPRRSSDDPEDPSDDGAWDGLDELAEEDDPIDILEETVTVDSLLGDGDLLPEEDVGEVVTDQHAELNLDPWDEDTFADIGLDADEAKVVLPWTTAAVVGGHSIQVILDPSRATSVWVGPNAPTQPIAIDLGPIVLHVQLRAEPGAEASIRLGRDALADRVWVSCDTLGES